MTFKLSNYKPDERPRLEPGTPAHAHASFYGALTTYGVESRESEIAYDKWMRLLSESQREPWNPEKWRHVAMRERGRR